MIFYSIRGLTLAEAGAKPKKLIRSRNVNYDAGADLLHHFQLEWNELHELAEENAQNAQEADALIATINEKLELQWSNIITLNNSLGSIPQINQTLQTLMDQIGEVKNQDFSLKWFNCKLVFTYMYDFSLSGSLQELFEEVDSAIFELEDLQQILDLQSSQLDHRFQLALYKEKKLSELKDIRGKFSEWNCTTSFIIVIYFKKSIYKSIVTVLLEQLASEHAEKVLKHEKEQEKHLKERQETFEEAFKEEIKEYKMTGSIPSKKY